MTNSRQTGPGTSDEAKALTKAVVRAADQLGLIAPVLASTIGTSQVTVSRMKRGAYMLDPASKSFELATLLVRLYRTLDIIVGGDQAAARSWLVSPNRNLDGRPVDKIGTIAGLVDVLAYLDARRTLA